MEREEMPVHALFVGAGPANLAGAIRLAELIEKHNEGVAAGSIEGEVLEDPMIAVIEKGSRVGAHQLSGAILDPKALDELIPDWKTREDFPVERYVEKDSLMFLTSTGHITAPWAPPEMRNMGKPIVSLGKFCNWLAEIAESKGVMVLPGFAGSDLLWEGESVRGVRTGDKGILADGSPGDAFEPGTDMTAPITILGEGTRGHLTRKLIERRQLDAGKNPMVYEIGVKEVIELPKGSVTEGFCIHGLGFPLDMKTFGGWFCYAMGGDQVALGLMVALDAADPYMDAHDLLQRLKMHPFIKEKLKGGKVVRYGAKSVTISGWSAVPQTYTDGAMLVGDSASFLNPFRVKGIHLSMKSGMLAAEAAFEALKRGDARANVLKQYQDALEKSWVADEMKFSRNFHAQFAGGLLSGSVKFGLSYLLGGTGSTDTPFEADYTHMKTLRDYYRSGPALAEPIPYDGTYLLKKLDDVYLSGTAHDEHQPAHLKIIDTEICVTKCREEFGNPCTKYCPAQVYNMVENPETGRLEMRVDFSNCVHCKSCDIRDPYQIITWVPPQGGDGPEYAIL